MRFLVISDIHARMEMVRRLMAVDMTAMDCIVIAGDITHFGGYVEAAAVLEPIIETNIPIVAVAGNCDTDGVEEYLADRKIGLQGQYLRLGDMVFVGVGGSLPCPKTTPGEYGDNMLETALSRAVRQAGESSGGRGWDSLIVVTHQPAFGTKVDSVGERYTGSAAIRRFIEIYQPVLAVSGHIHDAFGVDKVGKTILVNPGPLKEGRYAVVELQATAVNVSLKQL
jgi:Icc-related predicted phosphoesterase